MSNQSQGEMVLTAIKNLVIAVVKFCALIVAWIIKLTGSLCIYIATTINKYAGK